MRNEKNVFQNDSVEKSDYIAHIKESFRSQRHDFMNYFQIVYAYIQLGKTNEAIDSIKKVINLNMNLSNIYNISLFHISLYLDKLIRELNDLEYDTIIKANNHTNYDLRLISNEKNIVEELNHIFDNFISRDYTEGESSIVELEIEEFEDSISFLFIGKNNTSFVIESCGECQYSINERGVTVTFNIRS